MRISFCALILALLFGVLAGCQGNSADKQLQHAESVMDINPDSALAILQDINIHSIRSRKQKALYSLLSTQASYRCGEDIISDSMLHPAIEYFVDEKRGEDKYRFLTLYYQGEILRASGKPLEAILKLEEADNVSKRIPQNFYLPKMLSTLAISYSQLEDYPDELATTERLKEIYRRRNDTAGMYWTDFQRALSLMSNGRREESMNLLDSLPILYPGITHTQKDNIAISKADIYFKEGDYDKSYSLYTHAFACPETELNALGKAQYATILSYKGKNDSAQTILKQIRDESSSLESLEIYHQFKALTLANEGDYRHAVLHYDSLLKTDSIHIENLNNYNVLRMQRDINQERVASAEEKISLQHIVIWLLCISGVMLIICIFIQIRFYKVRKEKLESDRISMAVKLNEEIKSLTERITDFEQKANSLKEENELESENKGQTNTSSDSYINYLRYQNKQLDTLLKSYFSGINKEQSKNIVYNELEALLAHLVSETGIERLNKIINDSTGNVMQSLKEDFSLTDRDEKIILFTLYGLSYGTIANIINENARTVSSQKTRLIKKILTTPSPHQAQYTMIFSK